MIDITRDHVAAYLKEAYGPDAELLEAGEIGTLEEQGIKRFGYGKPLLIRWRAGGEEHEAVLSVMKGDKYGHQFYWDRAAILMFQYETGPLMERHVKPVGLGYVDRDMRMVPLTAPREFFILSEKAPGYDYYRDIVRIQKEGLSNGDTDMARQFARWLAEVHARRLDDPDLYYRRIRDLLGSSECIMGLVDEAYPHPYEAFGEERFKLLEKRLIDWRWRLRKYAHRLAEVHGDFHPWNVLVDDKGSFLVLDRSRGQWGEPAGDVASMAMNYLLFGLSGCEDGECGLSGPFMELYQAFFEDYLQATGDHECLKVMAPFLVFRCLVIASPEWYPDHPPSVRAGLLRFLENVLEDDAFDWLSVNKYME